MPADWIAFHVFYASDSNPIVVEAVRPLVRELRAEGKLDCWFFIKYWMEGPHLRVRLRPSSDDVADEVRRRTEVALNEFLQRRPALYSVDNDGLAPLYKKFYIAEYGAEAWQAAYGEHGKMTFRDNNSVHVMEYDREYSRYGGPHGMTIAERHFEKSSDLVSDVLAATNTNVRPLLLGLAAQFSLILAFSLLEDPDKVARFFRRYRTFWEVSFDEPSDAQHEAFERSLSLTGESLAKRIDDIRRAVAEPVIGSSSFEGQWLRHGRELRDQITADTDRLEFVGQGGSGEALVADPDALKAVLLTSFIHMTNNRLGLAILDEIYLSYLVERCLGLPMSMGDVA